MYAKCRKFFYTVEPLHNAYPRDKVRERVMTSQVSVRFFKYESSILKASHTQNTSTKRKPNIQNKFVRQNKAGNVQSVGTSTSLFTLV